MKNEYEEIPLLSSKFDAELSLDLVKNEDELVKLLLSIAGIDDR